MVTLPDAALAALEKWAALCPSILRLYIFGSWAKGTATERSDLDLAVVLSEAHGNQLSELIVNAAEWKKLLTNALGILVKDIYLADDPASVAYVAVREHGCLIFDRAAIG